MPFSVPDGRWLKGSARESLKQRGVFYTFGRALAVLPGIIFSSLPYLCWEYSGRAAALLLGPERALRLCFAVYRLRCRLGIIGRDRVFWPSKGFKSCLYKIAWVNPAEVGHSLSGGYVPYIQDGDWDLAKREFTLHENVRELFVDNIPAAETSQYRLMQQGVAAKDWRHTYWCRTAADVDRYFEELIGVYEDIKAKGYRTQAELGIGVPPGRYPGEILLSVGRNGELILESGGSHRLSMVKLLGIEKIPAVIVRKHYRYAAAQGRWLD